MRKTFSRGLQKFSNFVSALEFTSGIALVVVVSCALSIVANYLNISPDFLSLESSLLLSGHIHRLLTYSFYHKDVGHLFISVALLVFFCSGLENGLGTVRFLHQVLLLSTFVGMEHVLLELMLFSPSTRSSVSGLIPTSLAVLGMVTIGSRMRKAHLLGVSVPTATLPWILLLFVTLLTPNTVFLCNVLAVVTGEMCGMRWFSMLEMSEAKACVLEKKMPFRWLKKMAGVKYIPASAEERKKDLHTICSPPPGSYPVQAYAPASASAPQAAGSLPSSLEGWPHSAYIQQNYMVPSAYSEYAFGPGFGTSHGHGHGHCHHHHQSAPQARGLWMPTAPYVHSHFRTPVNVSGQTFVNPTEAATQATGQAPVTESLANTAMVHPVLSIEGH
ncbi:rhomboid domain-containing protein 2 [Electrophorus electricus]|uniref:Peptidase S54 rhomboid domain-containing protein n=1 Tax=Electrophorus electricus TaxID=8005 RepID=A0A4W4GJ27_ELEEL|nr:rhomboid domain-containing protein 2 [Electrophorus electricus]